MNKFNIITFGSAVVDAFVDVAVMEDKEKICFPLGSKILIENVNFSIGGGGTNTAVAFSKLGFKTGFVGKIGKGHNSGIILRELKNEKVKFLGVRGDEHTGYSVVLGGRGGERTILVYKGASNNLLFNEIKLKGLKSNWFYFSSMMGESFLTQKKLVNYAKKNGIKVAFNPSTYQVEKGLGELKKILENTDVFILNKQEAAYIVRSGDIKRIHGLGPKIVCITDGKNGNVASDGIYRYNAQAHKDIKCVERTGAGDAFASGFVSGLIKNKGIEEAIQMGSANAESTIQTPGAKNGLLTYNEMLKIIKRNPVKIIKEKYENNIF